MHLRDEPAPEWGRTKPVSLELVDGEWWCSDWYDAVDAPAEGLHHGSGGSIPADTVLVTLSDEVIALAHVFNFEAENAYCFDSEYYLVLRVREVLEPERWRELPWRDHAAGNVVHVWDKFHGVHYLRGQLEAGRVMSYGGDFADLEELVGRELPPPRPPLHVERPSPTSLLTAVREGDLAWVESLLARGVSPHDEGVPDGVRALELGVSVARPTSPLLESIASGGPELTRALLRAGAGPNEHHTGVMGPLHYAVVQRRPEHVRLLLEHGADPELIVAGKSARELAEAIDPELAALFRASRAHGG